MTLYTFPLEGWGARSTNQSTKGCDLKYLVLRDVQKDFCHICYHDQVSFSRVQYNWTPAQNDCSTRPGQQPNHPTSVMACEYRSTSHWPDGTWQSMGLLCQLIVQVCDTNTLYFRSFILCQLRCSFWSSFCCFTFNSLKSKHKTQLSLQSKTITPI